MEENPTYRYPTTLLLVDGGEPQVAAASRAVADSGISGISVAGLAKRLEEIWLPNSKYPVILPRNSEALYLVQRARDEAHRFAIRYQKSKRIVKLRSELEDIPGLGSKRVAALLKHFGSPDELRIAAPEQIAKVAGIGNETAKKIQRILNPDT
jgi:excinuclease ABC subunit C